MQTKWPNSLLNWGRAEDIAEHGETKAMKLEEKFRVVANNLKSLETVNQITNHDCGQSSTS